MVQVDIPLYIEGSQVISSWASIIKGAMVCRTVDGTVYRVYPNGSMITLDAGKPIRTWFA